MVRISQIARRDKMANMHNFVTSEPSKILLLLTQTRQINPDAIDQAIDILQRGGILGVPTETVYGLAADATNELAVQSIFAAKQRPQENPLIVHVVGIELAQRFVSIGHQWIWDCLELFSPGPISYVLPYTGGLAPSVTAGLPTVAIRIPNHTCFFSLLQQSRLPLAAPSANRSGRPSATTWQAVLEDLDGLIEGVICGEPCQHGIESTVIDATGPAPVILRSGAITLETLQKVAPNACLATPDSHLSKRSPGTRFRHYQPKPK